MYLIFNIEGYFLGVVNRQDCFDTNEYFVFEIQDLRDLKTIVKELENNCPQYLNDNFY